jgi:hypothetical protein
MWFKMRLRGSRFRVQRFKVQVSGVRKQKNIYHGDHGKSLNNNP